MIIEDGLYSGTLTVTFTDGDLRRSALRPNCAELKTYAVDYLKEHGQICDVRLKLTPEFKKASKFDKMLVPDNMALFGLLVVKAHFGQIVTQGLTINHPWTAARLEIVEGSALTMNLDAEGSIEELQGGRVVFKDGTVGRNYRRPKLRVAKGLVQSVEGQGDVQQGYEFKMSATEAGVRIKFESQKPIAGGTVRRFIHEASARVGRIARGR